VAVRAPAVTGLALTTRQACSGPSSEANSTVPPFRVGSLTSSNQPSRSTITTRRCCLSKRQPAGASKQRRSARVSPAAARTMISGDRRVLDSGTVQRSF